jgi:DNA-binding GntR family transcriptional regulator
MKSGSDAIAAIAERRSRSLSANVHDEIERMILEGELKPGERLNEQVLAARLGVSRGPVREAARALERSGLVTAIVNQGVYIRQVDVAEAVELYDMRAVVFGFACQRLAARVTEADKRSLRALVEAMETAIDADDPKRYFALNLEFHDRIIQASGHARAAQMYNSLLKESHLLRRRALTSRNAMRESNAEHARMLGAIEAGDAAVARAIAEEHHLGGKRRWLNTLYEEESR